MNAMNNSLPIRVQEGVKHPGRGMDTLQLSACLETRKGLRGIITRRPQSAEGGQAALCLNLGLPLTVWVALDKSLTLSELQFPHLQNKANFTSQGSCKD